MNINIDQVAKLNKLAIRIIIHGAIHGMIIAFSFMVMVNAAHTNQVPAEMMSGILAGLIYMMIYNALLEMRFNE